MRVVHYFPRARVGDGGISHSLRQLSSRMAGLGADVTIAYDAATRAPATDDAIRWVGVRHVGVGGIRVPADLGRVLRGADVLTLHSAWTAHNAAAGASARAHGLPYVLAPRGAYDPQIMLRRASLKRVWWRAFERRLVLGATAMHVFFESQRSHLKGLGYRGSVIVAPNGVAPPADAVWDGGSGNYLLYLGRFDPEHKGLDLLVEAIRALPESERPRLQLHGPDWRGGLQQVRAHVQRLGLEPWIFLGPAVYGEEKWKLMSAAKAFVYPSRWEGFGNSVAEAASIGVPTLLTDYPLGRHLAARQGAHLVQATASALAAGIRVVLGPGAGNLGHRARQVAQQTLSWEAVAASWLAQLAECCGRDASHPAAPVHPVNDA